MMVMERLNLEPQNTWVLRDKAIKKAMAKEEFIADEEEEKGDKKLDVMKGKNKVKINPSLGESIKAELDALKAQKIEEAMAAAKEAGPSPEEKTATYE